MNKEFRISNLVPVLILVVGVWFLLAVPTASFAAFFSEDEVVEITEPVNDDVYLVGERVIIEAAIQDDAYIAGSILEVAGAIGEDLMAAGNSLTISSAIGDDAFLAGDHITMEDGTSVGDLFAAGRVIEVREGVRVGGQSWLAGAVVTLHGSFNGDVRLYGESVEVGSDATIAGDLIVHGPTAPTVADGAEITGTVRHVPTMDRQEDGVRTLIARWVRNVLTWFIASLVLLYLAPRLTALVIQRVYTGTLVSFGIGLLWLMLAVPVTVALVLTVVGWPLALLVVLLSGLLMVLSASFVPLVVGTWLQRKFSSAALNLPLQWQHALLGAVVAVTVQLVPVIGPLVMFVIGAAILGTLLRNLRPNA